MTPFPTRPLGASGVRVGELGFGGATVGELHGPVPPEAAAEALAAAWDCGIRTYDTAPLYGAGEGERRMGAFLAGKPPEGVSLSTKAGWLVEDFGSARRVRADYSYTGTIASLEASLDRIGVSRFDAVFIHDLDASNHGEAIRERFSEAMAGAYPALDEWRRAGRIGAIGIGVNDPAICVAALERGRFDAFLIAGRYTLLDQGVLSELIPLCARRGVSLVVGAPFNTGILVKGAAPGVTFAHRPAPKAMLARVAAIQGPALRHGITLAAAALQFPLGSPTVASVLPGPRNAAQTREVAAAMRMPIPPVFWRDLKSAGLLDPEVPIPAGMESAA